MSVACTRSRLEGRALILTCYAAVSSYLNTLEEVGLA